MLITYPLEKPSLWSLPISAMQMLPLLLNSNRQFDQIWSWEEMHTSLGEADSSHTEGCQLLHHSGRRWQEKFIRGIGTLPQCLEGRRGGAVLGKVEYYVGLWSEHFRVSSQVLMEEGTKLIDQWKSILKFQVYFSVIFKLIIRTTERLFFKVHTWF